jgi:DNA-binding response OmpR family regulator
MAMKVLVAEDNLLVAEMIRLAVEDADFNVIGPAKNLAEGCRLAADAQLDGAFLDIKLGDQVSFPIARQLRSNGVPFIFVSGYDHSILPADLNTAPLISKPVFLRELTQVAKDSFVAEGGAVASPSPVAASRHAMLQARVAEAENRMATQLHRVQRLQVQGADPFAMQLAADLLDQMRIGVELMRDALRGIANAEKRIGDIITQPIDDGIVDPENPQNLARWADKFGVSLEQLLALADEVGPSVRAIARHLSRHTNGPSRKSSER